MTERESGARRPSPAQRAADIAAAQVEQIVAATQEASERIQAEARAEADALIRRARDEAEKMRATAREEAQAERADAQRQAIQLGNDARREAEERVAAAQAAADEALAEARAISRGLRQLAGSLTEQAERILRDVQTGHKRITADLRAAGGTGSSPRSARGSAEGARPERATRASGGDSPFELPNWVEP